MPSQEGCNASDWSTTRQSSQRDRRGIPLTQKREKPQVKLAEPEYGQNVSVTQFPITKDATSTTNASLHVRVDCRIVLQVKAASPRWTPCDSPCACPTLRSVLVPTGHQGLTPSLLGTLRWCFHQGRPKACLLRLRGSLFEYFSVSVKCCLSTYLHRGGLLGLFMHLLKRSGAEGSNL